MKELSFPMDPFNPGQYYACCGLLAIATRESRHVESRFDLGKAPVRRAHFVLRTTDEIDLNRLLSQLQDAEVKLEDLGSDENNAIRPVRLKLPNGDLVLDWWLDYFREKPQNLKCWAGQVTTGKLMEELKLALPVREGANELFFKGQMMKSKFGIDPRSAWNSLDLGYSPNEHGQDAATFAAVELLGAIGLQGYRPLSRTRDEVPFHLWRTWLGQVPARRAAVAPWAGLAATSFKFRIAKRGQSYKYFTFAESGEV